MSPATPVQDLLFVEGLGRHASAFASFRVEDLQALRQQVHRSQQSVSPAISGLSNAQFVKPVKLVVLHLVPTDDVQLECVASWTCQQSDQKHLRAQLSLSYCWPGGIKSVNTGQAYLLSGHTLLGTASRVVCRAFRVTFCSMVALAANMYPVDGQRVIQH